MSCYLKIKLSKFNPERKFKFPGKHLLLIFVTETISRTDEGQPRPKYIFNKCRTKSTFLLYRGLVHHHHRILNISEPIREKDLRDHCKSALKKFFLIIYVTHVVKKNISSNNRFLGLRANICEYKSWNLFNQLNVS